jgi:hypothetical protein
VIGRRLVVLVAALVVGLAVPGAALAAAPVAVDDPGPQCGFNNFGGTFPMPEDYRGREQDWPGHADWMLTIPPCDLLTNDTDADGDALTVHILTQPSHGQVMLVTPTWFAYRPDPDWSTIAGNLPGGQWVSDSFTYCAFDGTECSNPATMKFWIAPINDPPTFTPGASMITVDEDSGAYSQPWATDMSPGPNEATQTVSFEMLNVAYTHPALFTVPPSIDSNGVLTFTPAPNQHGLFLVQVDAKDDGGIEDYQMGNQTLHPPDDTSDSTSFYINVVSVPDPAVAVDDELTVPQDSPDAWTVDVLDNDTLADEVLTEVTAVSDPDPGAAAITGNRQTVAYTVDPGFSGDDTFTYTVTGGSTATVTVHVTPTPNDTDPPIVTAPAERFLGQTVEATTTKLHLTWGATDTGSGIASYKLQVSTDGGTYHTITLPHATSTSVDRTITNGKTYRFRVRATDKVGNVSSYAYGPTVTAARHSQESPMVSYVGSWSKTTSSKALGGSARNATSPSKSATFAFTGFDVGWIATRTTSSGHAQVLIDGVLVTTLDLHSHSTEYRKLIYQHHFSTLGVHTIQIIPVGDGRVDIDGFIILR